MPRPRWARTVTAPRSRSSPWDGERTATAHGPTAAQSAYPPPMDTVLPSSVDPGDDYLNVSVWAPAEGAARCRSWSGSTAERSSRGRTPSHLRRVRVRPRRRRGRGRQLPARRPGVRRARRSPDQPRPARPDRGAGVGARQRGRLRWRPRRRDGVRRVRRWDERRDADGLHLLRGASSTGPPSRAAAARRSARSTTPAGSVPRSPPTSGVPATAEAFAGPRPGGGRGRPDRRGPGDPGRPRPAAMGRDPSCAAASAS